METTHLVVLAVDMPFMTSEEMRRLCDKAMPGAGVVSVIGERAEPLAAIYPRESAPDFAAALAGSNFSLQGLVRKLAAANKVQNVSVLENDEYLYRSVNEPADFQRAEFSA